MPRSAELPRRLRELAESYGVADLYVFGSRAAEIAARVRGPEAPPEHATSDVDIGVRPQPGALEHVDDRVGLALALEDLFEVPRVDVVILPEAPPYLALEVVRGEIIYCADARSQVEYELYVMRRAADLAPLERARQRMLIFGER